jgi:hypothetical protein
MMVRLEAGEHPGRGIERSVEVEHAHRMPARRAALMNPR